MRGMILAGIDPIRSGMSGVSLSVTRPIGRALVVANPTSRSTLVGAAARLGFDHGECDDPYTAMLELTRRRFAYGALVLSLSSLYREELSMIATVKRRLPHLEIWLAHTDGRQAALAEAMRLGADGLIDDEGIHRIAAPAAASAEPITYHPMPTAPAAVPMEPARAETESTEELEEPAAESGIGEPVLTAEELRALLQDQPVMPPSAKPEE